MVLQKLIVIWVDGTFEGDNYQPMKDDFNEKIVGASASSDPINNSICRETQEDLVTNEAPVITVRTTDDAIKQIKNNPQAKIFFISSGSLGEHIVPTIVKQYPHVHSFYIYCFKIINHMHWALNIVVVF